MAAVESGNGKNLTKNCLLHTVPSYLCEVSRMLGGIALQLGEYIPSSSVFIIILKIIIQQSLLSYSTHSAADNFSYDTCGSDSSVLQNKSSEYYEDAIELKYDLNGKGLRGMSYKM